MATDNAHQEVLAANCIPAKRATRVSIGRVGGPFTLLRRQILTQPGDPTPVDVAGVNRVAWAVAGHRVGDELRRHAVIDQRVIEMESRQG